MLSTGQVNRTQERNLGAGIGPQTGVRIISEDRFAINSFTVRWDTGGMVVDRYRITLGSTRGDDDLYVSDYFGNSRMDADNEQRGSWTVTDINTPTAWVRLAYRYGDGEFRYVDQSIVIDTYTIPILTWDDATRWDDSKRWNE